MNSMRQKIELAVRCLPIPQHRENRIGAWVNSFALAMGPHPTATVTDWWGSPHEIQARLVPHSSAAKELQRLARALEELQAAISGLSVTANWAIDPVAANLLAKLWHHWPRELSAAIASAADREAKVAIEVPAKGRPVDQASEDLAVLASVGYFQLTDKPPTVPVNPMTNRAYGPYLALVEELFHIGGITSSAETFARKAIGLAQWSHTLRRK